MVGDGYSIGRTIRSAEREARGRRERSEATRDYRHASDNTPSVAEICGACGVRCLPLMTASGPRCEGCAAPAEPSEGQVVDSVMAAVVVKSIVWGSAAVVTVAAIATVAGTWPGWDKTMVTLAYLALLSIFVGLFGAVGGVMTWPLAERRCVRRVAAPEPVPIAPSPPPSGHQRSSHPGRRATRQARCRPSPSRSLHQPYG